MGTVYNHFDEKEDLLRALLEERMEGLVAELDHRAGDPPDFEAALTARLERTLGYVETHRAFFTVAAEHGAMGARSSSATVLGGKAGRSVARARAMFGSMVEEGIAAGFIESLDPARLARVLGAAVPGARARLVWKRANQPCRRCPTSRAPLLARRLPIHPSIIQTKSMSAAATTTLALPQGKELAYPKDKWLIAIAVTFGTLMGTIDTSIVNVALPHLRGTLSASVEEITWVSTGYVVASVIIMPLTAWLGARFGRKRIYLAGLALFLVGSFFCGAARSLPTLVFFRIVQGLGAGSLQPTEQAILRETFPPKEQGMAMGLYGFAIMLGPAIGPTLGGYIVDNYSWPWIFYINLPVGLVGLVMVWRIVHDPPYLERSKGGVDWWGMGLLVLGLGALQTLLEQGEQYNWFESKTNVGLRDDRGGLAGHVHRLGAHRGQPCGEPARAQEPLSGDGNGHRSRARRSALLDALLAPDLHARVPRLRRDADGTRLDAAVARHVGRDPHRRSHLQQDLPSRLVIAFGLALGAFTCFQMSRFTLATSHEEILWPQMIQGVALACIFIPLSTVALATIDRRRMGDATGLNNLVRQLGGSFGVAIFAALLDRYSTEGAARAELRTSPWAIKRCASD